MRPLLGLAVIGAWLVNVAIFVTVVAVAWHFISKFW